MANSPKLNTEVKQKDPAKELADINATATSQLSEPSLPDAPTKVEAIMDADVVAAVEASKVAAENQADNVAAKARLRNNQVSMNTTRNSVGESAELIASTQADAKKRGKDFSVCPISGVLVVG